MKRMKKPKPMLYDAHQTNFKMFKSKKRWVFACATMLGLLGAGASISNSSAYAAENEVQLIAPAVDAPTVNPFTTNDSILTGTASPGAAIHVNILLGDSFNATADADGNFSIEIGKQAVDTLITVDAMVDGVASQSVSLFVTEATEEKPVIKTVDAVTPTSTAITGTSTENATISVKKAGDEIGSGQADSDGNFSVTIPSQADKTDLTVDATVDGVVSDPYDITVTAAQVQVADPKLNDIYAGDVKITGTATPGDTVEITGDDITEKTATIGADGTFSFDVSAQVEGNTVNVQASQGTNKSNLVTKHVLPKQTTDLAAPVVNKPVKEGDTSISGSATPGTTVTITDADGKAVGSETIVADDGKFIVSVQALAPNAVLTVTVSDGSKTASTTVTVEPVTHETVLTPVVGSADTNTTTITGTTSPNAKVNISKSESTDTGYVNNGVADENGNFKISIAKQSKDTKLYVTATNDQGDISEATKITVTEAVADISISPVVIGAQSISGTGPQDGVVYFTDQAGKQIGSGFVGNDTTFTAPLLRATKAGEVLSVTSEYANTKPGPSTTVIVPDTVPATKQPTNVVAHPTEISGNAEPGSTIRVYTTEGSAPVSLIQSGETSSDGTFRISFDKAQAAGTNLLVVSSLGGVDSSYTPVTVQTTSNATLVGHDNIWSVFGTIEAPADSSFDNVILHRGDSRIGIATIDPDTHAFIIPLGDNLKLVPGEKLTLTTTDSSNPENIADPIEVDVSLAVILHPEAGVMAVEGYAINPVDRTEVTLQDAEGNSVAVGNEDAKGYFSLPLEHALDITQEYTLKIGEYTMKYKVADISSELPELNENETELSGTTTPGTLVTAQNINNHVYAHATVADDQGNYTILLSNAAKTGDEFLITWTDQVQNTNVVKKLTVE